MNPVDHPLGKRHHCWVNNEDGVAYFEVRPISTAYLIPKSDPEAIVQLDSIIRHAHETWGGRFYPIFLTDGKSLSDADWNLLSAVDPDIIISSIPLERSLLQELDRKLTPLSIDLPRDQGTTSSTFEAGVRSGYEGFPIYPSAHNVRTALGIPAIARQPSLVKFEFATDADPLCRQFISRNFGRFSDIWVADSALNENQVELYMIKDLDSVMAALSTLSRWDPVIYPVHLCAHPWKWFRAKGVPHQNKFAVVVGDQLSDLTYFWNRIFLNDFGDRPILSQLWLPTRLAEDASFCRVLSKWLSIVSHSFTNSHDEILITSTSMTPAELSGFEARLRDGSYLRVTQENTPPTPIYEKSYAFINRRRDSRPTPMPVSKNTHFSMSPPDVFSNLSNGHWMVDCFIEHRSRMHDGVIGRTLWWQLPQRRQLAREIFARPARIRDEGIPSVLMDSNPHCPWDSPNTISISSPSPGRLITALCCGERQPQYLRSKEQPSEHIGPYRDLAISDKGGYLRGVIELLGGLHYASQTFESRLWRGILSKLGRSDPEAAAELRTQVDRIWSETEPLKSTVEERFGIFSERLATLVRSIARKESAGARAMTYEEIRQTASRELNDYNTLAKSSGGPQFQHNPEAVKRSLSELTERNVIWIGYDLSCDHCFFKNWKRIDEARQSGICDGCGKSFSFPPEAKMSYRLNHLVHLAVNHQGVVPVLLVLGDLFRQSRASFYFLPSLNLYEESSGGPAAELDIVCIQDGKFIIGEVKTSAGAFRQQHFDKAREVALKLRPNVVLFAALEGEASQDVVEMMASLKAELRSQGTDVLWHRLPSHIFEPAPDR